MCITIEKEPMAIERIQPYDECTRAFWSALLNMGQSRAINGRKTNEQINKRIVTTAKSEISIIYTHTHTLSALKHTQFYHSLDTHTVCSCARVDPFDLNS